MSNVWDTLQKDKLFCDIALEEPWAMNDPKYNAEGVGGTVVTRNFPGSVAQACFKEDAEFMIRAREMWPRYWKALDYMLNQTEDGVAQYAVQKLLETGELP